MWRQLFILEIFWWAGDGGGEIFDSVCFVKKVEDVCNVWNVCYVWKKFVSEKDIYVLY
jgi:hypothetical protein